MGSELLDEGAAPSSEVCRSLLDLRRVNRFFGGRRILIGAVLGEAARLGLRRFRFLDVASGSCDLPLALLGAAEERGIHAEGFALEYWHRHMAMFRGDWTNRCNFQPICADAFRAPFADRTFDLVTCSLFFHHLTEDQAIALLAQMSRWARHAVIISDLERHPLAYYFFRVCSRFFTRSPVSRVDGAISLRQSFRIKELQRIGERAGLKDFTVERRWPFRLLLVARVSGFTPPNAAV